MHGTARTMDAARERAYSLPLDQFDVGNLGLFQKYEFWPYFERLRKEDPVHYCKDLMFGPYWSVTKYNDIMSVETNHGVFSSAAALGGINIRNPVDTRFERFELFITMDEPRHAPQRRTVAPMFTPTHLDEMAINIRKRSETVLDNLPRNETFDWVDRVSIELTTQMLAVLFDFPWEERRKLTRWSDVVTAVPGGGPDAERRHVAQLRADHRRARLDGVGSADQGAARREPTPDDDVDPAPARSEPGKARVARDLEESDD